MTSPRLIVSGATTAITRRTAFRKAFLGPWDPMVSQIWLYALADAQLHTKVAIHHGCLVLNHQHLTVTPSYDNMPEFVRRVHRDMSCALNTLLAHQRYDAPRELFDGRAPHYQRLCDDTSQATRLIYDHMNCVHAGLVERPEDMPDHILRFALWRQGYLEVRRPPIYFGDNERARPEVLRLQLTPPPLLYEAFGGNLDKLIYHLEKLQEEAVQRARATRVRPVLGARAVRRLHPWSEPRSLREAGGKHVPTFSIGARGAAGRDQNIRAAREVRVFRRTHHDVRLARREGRRGPKYPFGTYAMRVIHDAPVEENAPEDAIVGLPGPLLCDVQARMRDPEPRLRAFDLLADVRASFEDEEQTRIAPDTMDFARHDDAKALEQDEVVTCHRFDPPESMPHAASSASDSARRLVILRDRRMGRPRSANHRHGADPPC